MKPFRFGLERVLAWRRSRLSLEEARLEQLTAERKRLEAERASIAAFRESSVAGVRGAASITGRDLAALDGLLLRLNRAERSAQALLAAGDQAILQQRAVVTEARRRVRLLERLKDRRRETWETEFGRELEDLAAEASAGQWRRAGLSHQDGGV